MLSPMNHPTTTSRPRGPPREFDRDKALERAMLLFWRHRYEATPVSALTHAMDITPPALYVAFGDKKRLFLEAVMRYQQGMGCLARKALTDESTAERAIHSLLLGAIKTFTDPTRPKGCCGARCHQLHERVGGHL